MSAPKVDVLAVLDEAADWLYRSSEGRGDDDRAEAVREALAAVAALIKASRRAERLIRDMSEAGFGDPAQADDLRDAIARIGGDA